MVGWVVIHWGATHPGVTLIQRKHGDSRSEEQENINILPNFDLKTGTCARTYRVNHEDCAKFVNKKMYS